MRVKKVMPHFLFPSANATLIISEVDKWELYANTGSINIRGITGVDQRKEAKQGC